MIDSKPSSKLSLNSLVMITVLSVDSIRNLPAAAKFGSILVTFYLLSALFFLIPTALVSAELSATYNCSGGIYTWVKKAFGDRAAVFAIWLQWIENVIWYPTILSFVVGAIATVVAPELSQNPYYLALSIIVLFWLLTWVNLKGINASALFNNACTITGLILPMILIITLGAMWVLNDNPLAISLTWSSFIPSESHQGLWVSLTAIMLSFSGVEIATVHANDVENPKEKFPKALAYATFIIVSTLTLGSLAIAIVIPPNDINLITGIIQAFTIFFTAHHIVWLLPIMALTLAIGAAGTVSNWIIAPTRGLLFAAEDKNLPQILAQTNTQGAPNALLYIQAIIVSIIALIFIFIPDINASYWLLTVVATQLYMAMYVIMFLAFIALRKTGNAHNQGFVVPGKTVGMIVTATLGLIGCITTFIVSFMLPEGLSVDSQFVYAAKLIVVFMLLCLPPYFLYQRQ